MSAYLDNSLRLTSIEPAAIRYAPPTMLRDGNITMRYLLGSLLLMNLMGSIAFAETPADNDSYLWLEDINGQRALQWVQARNEVSKKELESDPQFATLQARLLSIFESKERIPYVLKEGKYFYNFWRDSEHIRGVWR